VQKAFGAAKSIFGPISPIDRKNPYLTERRTNNSIRAKDGVKKIKSS
jgi:hypothetical protein